ncbi:hypothetical protein VNO80_18943 [Phaseolus coccineus]|uniref:Uncharacterized protein n=1 Tax=Phaseolus coccineus TaxID=3886 RepID=A0AAN9QWW2_PHACN
MILNYEHNPLLHPHHFDLHFLALVTRIMRDEVKFVAGKSWNLLSLVVRVASVIASLIFSCVQSQFYPYMQECQGVKVEAFD